MDREVVATITDRQPDCGLWELTFCGEFDGLRRKGVLVEIVGE